MGAREHDRPDAAAAAASVRPWLASVVVVTLGWALAAPDATGEDATSTVVSQAGLWLSTAVIARRASGADDARGWWALAAGLGLWALGDLVWLALGGAAAVPLPSAADALYLPSYLASAAGIVLLLPRTPSVHRGMALDGIVVAGLAAVLFVAVVGDEVSASLTGLSTVAGVTTVAYPVLDAVVLAVVVATAARRGWVCGPRELALLGGAALLVAVDGAYVVGSGAGTVLNAGYVAVAVAWASAATFPPTAPRTAAVPPAWTTAIPMVGIAVAVAVLLTPTDTAANVVAAALTLVCGARFVLTAIEHRALAEASSERADTDTLTGLRNRRRLLEDLAAVDDTPRVFVLFDLDGFKHYNDTFGHPAGDVLLERVAARLRDRVGSRGIAYRLGGDEFCALVVTPAAGPGVGEDLAAAMLHTGPGFHISASFGVVRIPGEGRTPAEVLALADRRMYARKHARAVAAGPEGDVLLALLGECAPALGRHVDAVAELAAAVGRRLGLTAAELADVRLAAELHDIGKIAIPDAVLDKPGPLSPEETAIVRAHTVIGQRILSAAPALSGVGEVVRASHERWDGGGYPDGAAGTAIPLGARIVAACDAFHAMTTDRCYRAARPVSLAVDELRRERGRQFAPSVVDALVAEIAERARTRVSPGAEGVVRSSRPG